MIAGDRGLALVGYRGTGKSSVGRILADRLGRPFADADREIEARSGRTIRAIFAEGGEPAFRAIEAGVIRDLTASLAGGIIATGGGAVLSGPNRQALRAFGFVAWLTADPETLSARLAHSRGGVAARPALTAAGTLAEIADVLAARSPLYREAAHAEVDTAGRTTREVAEAVLGAWAEGGASP